MKEQAKKPESRLVQLAKQAEKDNERWLGESHCNKSIPHHTLALASEVGQFANIIRKIEQGQLSLNDAPVRYNLAVELTEVFGELLQLASLLHIDLEESHKYVRAANEKKYKEECTRRESNGRV